MKEQIINHIIGLEGGYVDDPADSGGKTNYGITESVARANGYDGEMSAMPQSLAFDIYAKKYWDAVKADELCAIDKRIALEVVDTGVNMGTGRAVKFLQRALDVLSSHDVAVDGAIGSKTIAALVDYMARRNDPGTLLKALNCMQGEFYISLAERREKDKAFVYGWLRNRVEI